MSPEELVTITSPQINAAGAAFYFHPDTLAVGKELGLDGFRFYVLGRGGVLGDVEPTVVSAAFGYFHPALVAKIWNTAKERLAPRAAATAYGDCASAFGRAKLSGVDGLDRFNATAEAVTADVEVSALPLFAGTVAEPLPDDPAARAYRNVCTLRELRGSVHLVAIVASGLPHGTAHAIRRPDDVAAFGWDPAPAVGATDLDRLASADALTDALMLPMFAGLDDEQRQAFADTCAAISDRVT